MRGPSPNGLVTAELVPITVTLRLGAPDGPALAGHAALLDYDNPVAQAATDAHGVARLWGNAGRHYYAAGYARNATAENGDWIRPVPGAPLATVVVLYPWQEVMQLNGTMPPLADPPGEARWHFQPAFAALNETGESDVVNAKSVRVVTVAARLEWTEVAPGVTLQPAVQVREGTRTTLDSVDERNGTLGERHSRFFRVEISEQDRSTLRVGAYGATPASPPQPYTLRLCITYEGEGRWDPRAYSRFPPFPPPNVPACPADLLDGPPAASGYD